MRNSTKNSAVFSILNSAVSSALNLVYGGKETQANVSSDISSKNDFFLSRIDRSVADNLHDIRKSFGEDAGIVKDFIVFISKNLKKDLLGTLNLR